MGILKKLYIAICWFLSLLLPIDKNKVVFCSHYGRGYSDNSKAIADAMLKANTKAKLVWLLKDEKDAKTLPEGIIPCPYDSAKRVWQLATARVWVDNCRKYDRVKKKGQYYLQTWHGFPLKRIEKDAMDVLPAFYEKGAKKDSAKIDLLLSNSGFVTETLRHCFWYDGEIAEFGSPRNDVFINGDAEAAEKVRAAIGVENERKLVLFAPTFRADNSKEPYKIDAKMLCRAFEKRFGGKWSVLIRLHPNVAKDSEGLFAYDDEVIDATMYSDMQELLCASDILITDYSSSMFDFALSGKPCIRYASDLDDYMKDRNFYFDYEEIPFPYATSNQDLEKLIENFDVELYNKARDKFYAEIGIVEDGKASCRCAEWIEDKLEG